MEIAALLLSVVALLLTVYMHRRLSRLREDLLYTHRTTQISLEQLEDRILELRSETDKKLASLKTAPSASKGSWFTPYMTIQDALNLHPGVKEVLASMHIGGCSSCSVSSRETLEQAAAGHGVDLQEMLTKMNDLMEKGAPNLVDQLAAAEKSLPPANGGRVMLGVGKG